MGGVERTIAPTQLERGSEDKVGSFGEPSSGRDAAALRNRWVLPRGDEMRRLLLVSCRCGREAKSKHVAAPMPMAVSPSPTVAVCVPLCLFLECHDRNSANIGHSRPESLREQCLLDVHDKNRDQAPTAFQGHHIK